MIAAKESRFPHAMVMTWEHLGPEDDAQSVNASEFPVMTVTVDGGAVQLVGRNRPDGAWWPLTDVTGFPIKSPGMYLVTMNPWELKPVATTGARVTVTICATRS